MPRSNLAALGRVPPIMVLCHRSRAVALIVPGALLALATSAGAHGALQNPASRSVHCDPGNEEAARSAACRAAAKVAGAAALAEWDELRVPDVRGRDREVIPDGKLCSAGIGRFRGLDLARTDWPTTKLVSAARFSFRYRVSIPHRGSFRLYVTRDGFIPSRPLTWSALEAKPFLEVTDPPRRGGSYTFSGPLPKGKSGRHMIYTVWQNSDTPDTYYSCSDVVFGPEVTADAPQQETSTPVADTSPQRKGGYAGLSNTVLLAAGGGAIVLLAIVVAMLVGLVRWLRVRREF